MFNAKWYELSKSSILYLYYQCIKFLYNIYNDRVIVHGKISESKVVNNMLN